MKPTKTLLIAALAAGALIMGSSSLLAQDANANATPSPSMKGGRHDIAKELNLTDAQKPKFQEIMRNSREKLKTLHEGTSLTQDEKKAKAKEIREDVNAKMKALLTEDQYDKWQKMTKPGHHKAPATDDAGTPPPQK